MTDHEASMKLHVSKVHTEKLKSLIDTDMYIEENAWLDMILFLSIKDIEKEAKTIRIVPSQPKFG